GGDPGGISLAWELETDEAFANLGESVAGVGDVDGDGLPDLLLGAPSLMVNGASDMQGQVLGIRGGGGEVGPLRALDQWRVRSDRPIVPQGLSDAFESFRIVAEVSTQDLKSSALATAGLEVWLEWEIKELGVPFDGIGLQHSLPQAVPPVDATLRFEETLHGLTHNTAYRWRARLRTADPLLPVTRWQTPAGANASNELHFRTRNRLSSKSSVSMTPTFGPVTQAP
ncbi:MAG: integrin alpha, partial [Planctomycetota bacterium]